MCHDRNDGNDMTRRMTTRMMLIILMITIIKYSMNAAWGAVLGTPKHNRQQAMSIAALSAGLLHTARHLNNVQTLFLISTQLFVGL